MSRLRIYMRASGDSALHRSGFSWTAAFVFPLWALTRRLYKTAAVSCVVVFALSQLIPPLFSLIHDPVVQGVATLVHCSMNEFKPRDACRGMARGRRLQGRTPSIGSCEC